MAETLDLNIGIGGEAAFNSAVANMSHAIERLNSFVNVLNKTLDRNQKENEETKEKIKPVEGSINHLSEELRNLNQQFLATGSAIERAKIKEKMDALNKELKEMSGAGGGGGSVPKATSAMGMFTSALGTLGITIGAAAIVGGLKSLGQAAVGAAMEYESLGIQLEVLLGDAKQVPKVLAEWKRFSDATPFEPDQVNKAGKQLVAFGFQTQDVIPILTKIGDVAAGTGKDFNELATIYGKARIAGVIQGDELNQLAEAGIPIMDDLAKVLGVHVTQVKKMGAEGKITFPLFQKAFDGLAASKYPNMMEKLSQSTEGLISTMKGEFTGLLREIGNQVLPFIKSAVQSLIPIIQNLAKQVPAAFAAIKEQAMLIIKPLQSIWDSLSKVKEMFNFAGESSSLFGTTLSVVMPNIEMIGKILNVFAGIIGFVVDAVDAVRGAWMKFVDDHPKIAKAIEVVTAIIGGMLNPLKTIKTLWDSVFGDDTPVKTFSEETKKRVLATTEELKKSFNATGVQVADFARQFDYSKVAGLSQADAMHEIKRSFANYLATLESCTDTQAAFNEEITATDGKVHPLAGSIAKAEEELKKLKDQFNNVTTDLERRGLVKQIEDLEAAIYRMKNLTKMEETIKFKVEIPKIGETAPSDAEVEKLLNIPKEATKAYIESQKHLEEYMKMTSNEFPQFAGQTSFQLTTIWDKLSNSIGVTATAKLKEGLESIKAAFRDVGIQAVESFGYAIGASESGAEAMKAAIRGLLIEVPKLAGMALLNAAATTTSPASLPMAIAGLALIGMSGLMRGIQDRQAKEIADATADIPMGASGSIGGASSMGGLGQFANVQQAAPIYINLNAEMDDVKLGGLFRRVTTSYSKGSIKQM